MASTLVVMLATWRLFKRQSFFVLVLILLLEAVLFFSISATAEEPYNLAPTLMIIALLVLSVGIKPAFSYLFSLLINLALAVAAAFLVEFLRKYLQKKQEDDAARTQMQRADEDFED